MSKVSSKLTVYFEASFWVGVFEIIENGTLSAAKVIFGTEPKDYEVYEFISKHYYSLRFRPAIATAVKENKINPKRMQHEIEKQLCNNGVGTKSQQALKLQQEQCKQERKSKKRNMKLTESKRIFELKQQEKKEKHRGR